MTHLDALSTSLWLSFVENVQNVVQAGLERLAADARDDEFGSRCENDLNRELFFRMKRIASDRHRALLSLSPRPALAREHTWNLTAIYEANNQPSPDDSERTPRENKRPDFQWSVQDEQAADPERATRTYVVECKRLGEPADAWAFNTNYVAYGVRRYVDISHLYGKDDIGGAMIGYMQSMDIETIWSEVGRQLGNAGLSMLPKPLPVSGSSVLHHASHELTRMEAASPFQLRHVWVDLRPSA